ncbi:hypothetical protein KZA27_05160 [Staphylococcus capitis]|uniref:Phage protein n=1 Tax=Staphylococcus capitis TaxID=29388 RepID=A0A848EZS6_STACP|nr:MULTISPECIES: hypothetical protein [Staphylococcus]EGS40347.1 conserved domain protein [Staphylococcus capitis VCU116]MCC0830956.1 hypothetical protein [Staphylococcus capitis]MDS0178512.1 hypothetical protein [Staphylococcus capitis]MDS0191404.1 hypothetical protein [Staphylococcus capitis]MDS0196206.1 hypothetical protein [Staphylococcus capitis]
MENQKLIEHRLNAHDERARNQEKQITEIESELKKLKERENDRYIEMSKMNAKLDTDTKNTKEVVDRLVNSVEKLVVKIDDMTKNYSEYSSVVERRFSKVENRVSNILNDKEVKANTLNSIEDEGKTMGKATFTTITISIIGVIEVFVRYVAPLFFK